MALRSYVGGEWAVPSDEGVPLFDAVTGEQVATVSSRGIDMAAVLRHTAARSAVPRCAR